MPLSMEMKSQQLDDPGIRALYAELAEVIEWAPDDVRLAGVADRLVAQFEAVPAAAFEEDPLPDDLADLLATAFIDSVPAGGRILELLEERGWTGWTKLEPIVQGSKRDVR